MTDNQPADRTRIAVDCIKASLEEVAELLDAGKFVAAQQALRPASYNLAVLVKKARS